MLYSYIICHFFTFACSIHAITNFLNTKTTGTLSFLMPCKQIIMLKFLIDLYSSNKFHLMVLFLQVKTKQLSLRILGALVSQRILFWWLVINFIIENSAEVWFLNFWIFAMRRSSYKKGVEQTYLKKQLNNSPVIVWLFKHNYFM